MYSVVLGSVDIQSDKNSYYKLQVLEHDKKPRWYLWRSWGRVGTTIGGNKKEDFDEKIEGNFNSFVSCLFAFSYAIFCILLHCWFIFCQLFVYILTAFTFLSAVCLHF